MIRREIRWCVNIHPNPKDHTDKCRTCFNAVTRGDYQELFGLPITAPNPGLVFVGSYNKAPSLPDNIRIGYCHTTRMYNWTVYYEGQEVGRDTENTFQEAIAAARDVLSIRAPKSYQAKVSGVQFNQNNLAPGVPGMRFNSSLIEWKNQYLMAFRNGWAGSEVYVIPFSKELKPVGDAIKLDLFHPSRAHYGREDPRLFYYRGKLHVAYIGVEGKYGPTSVLYARLSDDLKVEAKYYPHYANRNSWEKNWQFFEGLDENLYAVYSFAPHKILRVDGERTELVYETTTRAEWNLRTEIRGGASPVRVGDEWWSFFHTRVEHNSNRVYVAGLYTFDVNPPFRVRRIISDPILWANTNNKPSDQYAHVIFPCGAVRQEDKWILCCGVHDRWTELHEFSHADLESRLREFTPPKWWSHREDWADPGIFVHVVGKDEYRLEKLGLKSTDVCIDVGAHVGSFAYKARKCGAGKVYCYEPWEESFQLLLANAKRIEGVEAIRAAVGKEQGVARFTGLTHDVNTGSGNVTLDEKGDILVVPLDAMIRYALDDSQKDRIKVLKLDCEGGEGPALEGATLLDRVDVIVGEWHPPYDAEWIRSKLEGFSVETIDVEDGRGMFYATSHNRS